MNTPAEILTYAEQYGIAMFVKDDHIVMDAPEGVLTDEFLGSAKTHKAELIAALMQERWNPELAAEGYTWCYDCRHWNGQHCTEPDNPFRKQCPQVPRLCKWFKTSDM